MVVAIEGKELVIRLPLQEPTPSQSGKTLIIAGTGGFARSSATLNGKVVSISVNATIPNSNV